MSPRQICKIVKVPPHVVISYYLLPSPVRSSPYRNDVKFYYEIIKYVRIRTRGALIYSLSFIVSGREGGNEEDRRIERE